MFRTNGETTLRHCGTVARDQRHADENVSILRDDGCSPNLDGCWYSPATLVALIPPPESYYDGDDLNECKRYIPDRLDQFCVTGPNGKLL